MSTPARPRFPRFVTGQVDGVTVMHATVPGPLRACLTFRVGQADEALHEHGLTHLVEHLALTRTPEKLHAFNGFTGPSYTSFVTAGTAEDVTTYLDEVCTSLSHPPLERLEHEVGVLRAEAAQRFRGLDDQLIWRFGPRGFGLPAYAEFVLRTVTAEQVQAWCRTWFTRDNAVLWLSAPPPPGLRLPLVEGVRRPITADPYDSATAAPFAYRRHAPGVAWSFLSQRDGTTTPLLDIVEGRVTRDLRHGRGLSYGTRAGIEPLDGETSLCSFHVDATEENAAAVQQGVVAVLTRLHDEAPTAEEVQRYLSRLDLSLQEPSYPLSYLDYTAKHHLLGRKTTTLTAYVKEIRALSAADLQAAAARALDTLVLGVGDPEQVPAELARPEADWSKQVFTGTKIRPVHDFPEPHVDHVAVSDQGISLVFKQGEAISIPAGAGVTAFRFDDGSLEVYAPDGCRIWLAKEDWPGLAAVDLWAQRQPAGTVQPAGSRLPREVAPDPVKPRKERSKTTIGGGWAAAILVVFVARLAFVVADSGSDTDRPDPSTVPIPVRPGVTLADIGEGGCFNDQSDGLLTEVLCVSSHDAEVLAVLRPVPADATEATKRCTSIWSGTPNEATFRVTATANGSAGWSCVLRAVSGSSTSGSALTG